LKAFEQFSSAVIFFCLWKIEENIISFLITQLRKNLKQILAYADSVKLAKLID